MRACIGLLALILASCASTSRGSGTHRVEGRILSARAVDLWIGHNFTAFPLYEFRREGSREGSIGLIEAPAGQCPYNSRPGKQLFRIEYSGHGAIVDTGSDHDRLPSRLATRYYISSCTLIAENTPPLRQ